MLAALALLLIDGLRPLLTRAHLTRPCLTRLGNRRARGCGFSSAVRWVRSAVSWVRCAVDATGLRWAGVASEGPRKGFGEEGCGAHLWTCSDGAGLCGSKVMGKSVGDGVVVVGCNRGDGNCRWSCWLEVTWWPYRHAGLAWRADSLIPSIFLSLPPFRSMRGQRLQS